MTKACILIQTESGGVIESLRRIRDIGRVRRAFPVYGRYDIVVFIEGTDLKELNDVILEINCLKGIDKTETLLEA
ncbi:MAG: Lrp/AsnC ligand binding domain-containing protein [Promethearchaeota archaeon]